MHRVKCKIAVCLFLAVCLTLPACARRRTARTVAVSVETAAAAMLASQEELPTLYAASPGDGQYAAFAAQCLREYGDQAEDGVICYPSGVDATEVAVFLFLDGDTASQAAQELESYREGRVGAFTGYAPEQAALAENGMTAVSGRYAALIICADPSVARDAFESCFKSGAPTAVLEDYTLPAEGASADQPQQETPVPATAGPAEGTYDHDAVLTAWETGDRAGLTEKNLAVLEAASGVIEQVVREDMSAYEKELAIHDWMIQWAQYDTNRLARLPDYEPDPDNDNPYGLLIGQRGICLGYTTTFQLFMDMLGIECVSVQGKANADQDDHAWNMVRLDGEWYCVDVTWDDPLSDSPVSVESAHRYFNVTSQFMRETRHFWDETAVEEATATAYRWTGG